MDREKAGEICQGALWRILDEHWLNEKKMKNDVTKQSAAAYSASTRMAMVAIEALHEIKELKEAAATRLIGEIASAAGTAMSIVTADQCEQSARAIGDNR